MKKEQLKANWEQAVEEGASYVVLAFELPNHPEHELIINPIENVEAKLSYLDKVYNDDLEGIHAPVKIVKFGWVHSLDQVEYVVNNFDGGLQ